MGRGAGQSKDAGAPTALSRRSHEKGTDFWDRQWGSEFDRYFEMTEHDYDPRNDFEIRLDQLDHPDIRLAQGWLDRFARSKQSWFEKAHVYPAREGMGQAVGMYITGSYDEPVIMVNLDAHELPDDHYPMPELKHQEITQAVFKTVQHELRHAWQDWMGLPGDEDDAEGHEWAPLD